MRGDCNYQCYFHKQCCFCVYPVQKLQAKKATLERVSSTANAAKVEKWQTVLVLSFMSSEESGEDKSEQPIIYVKPLSWRQPQVNKFFMQMDDRSTNQNIRKSRCSHVYKAKCHRGLDQQSFHTTSRVYCEQNVKLESP